MTMNEWRPPRYFFEELDEIFNFDSESASLEAEDEWGDKIFVCPPRVAKNLNLWVARAAAEANNGNLIVMLLPADTNSEWFHDFIYRKRGVDCVFLKGEFNSNPGPLMIVVFNPPLHPSHIAALERVYI